MPISQILLTSGSGGGGGPFLSIYGYVSSMNEGSTNTVNVDYRNYPPTTIYWQIVNDTTTNADWVTAEPNGMPLGDFYIEGTGTTSFSWTTAEDLTTEGDQTYYLNVGTALGGNDLFNGLFTVTDTSQTPPTPTYSLAPGGANNINEGSGLQFNVGGTDVPAGTYYWTIETGAGDFATTNGTVSVSAGTGSSLGSFTVTPSADATTEGIETFTVALRSVSITGDILASSGADINDTSLTPKLQLTSGQALGFNGTDNRHVVISNNQSDWDLGDNWTIEWWQKVAGDAEGFLSILSLDSNVAPYAGIDIFINNGSIQMANGNLNFSEAAATREEWNHIAIQKNGTTLAAYINGVSQTVNGSFNGTIISSSPLNLVIGSRTYDGGTNFYGQYFNGVLSNIRISNIARYSATFTPPTTVTVDANTKLSLDGSVGGGGMLVDETERHTITNVGATIVTII